MDKTIVSQHNAEENHNKIVFFDMDDTLHEAEDHAMLETWNKLLAPWQIIWKETANTPKGWRVVTEEERPGVGIRPLEVVKHFINLYGLDPAKADMKALAEFGIQEEEVHKLVGSMNDLDQEARVHEWAKLLETARVKIPEQIIRELGVKEIPGAVELIKSIKQEGYRVGVVTSGSLAYANLVLEKLGLKFDFRHPGNQDEQDKGEIDVIISGDMVEKPKPDREPHDLALEVMNAIHNLDLKPVAMFGDSNSDAMLAMNAGIPKVFIHKSQYLKEDKMKEMKLKLGDRIQFVDEWKDVSVQDLREDNTMLEGQPAGAEILR